MLAWLLSFAGCVEWFEVDDSPLASNAAEESPPPQPLYGVEASLPGVAPRLGASGPLVPQSAGLRVPDGYWSRIRVDQADILLPYTWAALEPAGYSAGGEARGTILRLQAHQGAEPSKESPALRGVIRIATPPETETSSLVGLEFGPDALHGSTVSVRLSKGTLWSVELERLSIGELGPRVISGTLEGQARAGKRAKRQRRFRAAFVALGVSDVAGSEASKP